jgi:ATP-dependent protease ClpP protease subunit
MQEYKVYKNTASTAFPLSNPDKIDKLKSGSELYDLTVETQVVARNIFHAHISSEIGDSQEYTELLNVLRRAEEQDEVHIYLNSPGGYISTTIQIVNAMSLCKGTVITHACGMIASAATLIFLAGRGQVIMDDVQFMCHYYSGCAWGKGQELETQAKFYKKSHQKFMWRFYEGFLSEKEFKRMCKGEDFWMGAKEVAKRLKKRIALLDLPQKDINDNLSEDGEYEEEVEVETKPKKKKKKSKK